MRRVILAVTATIAGLVALLSFKTHSPERSILTPSAAGDSGAGVTGTGTGGTGTAGASTGGAGTGGAGTGGAATGTLTAGERAVIGNVADTDYGPVQVQVIVKAGQIVKVNILEQPESTQEDIQIGQYAFPQLIAETVRAQSARIDAVSGASYTSGGYIQSLQSALDNGA